MSDLITAEPLVLMGAQRPLKAGSADAPINLLAAVRLACSPEVADNTVLVVLNDQEHSALTINCDLATRQDYFDSY